MKSKKDWLISMSNADDIYIKEADPANPRRKILWNKRLIGAIAACICLCMCSLWLFVPYNTSPPSIRQYEGSEYFSVIDKINLATFSKPTHKNNYEYFVDSLMSVSFGCAGAAPEDMESIPDMDGGEAEYEEITDNQTFGVTEADKIKRSTEHIYYLYEDSLEIYSIAKDKAKVYINTPNLKRKAML